MKEMLETQIWSIGREDPLQKEMDTHSSIPEYFSILAWEIPWIEEPGGLQSMVSQRIGHDWVTEHLCIGIYTELTGNMKNEAKIEKKKKKKNGLYNTE